MIAWFRRLLGRTPALSKATADDAAAMSLLHGAAFQRGWSVPEFEQLLFDRAVAAHRATAGNTLRGFIISRSAAGEAEILSVAVAARFRGQGIAARLLHLHLRHLAGTDCQAVFLEVDENNEPACRLYRRAGFREVGRRAAYYRHGTGNSNALILRRDLA